MTKLTLIIVLFLSFLFDTNVPTGKFSKPGTYERYEIKLYPDNTFYQKVGGCLSTYIAKGKWTTKQDTIILTADKIYDSHGTRKKTLQDTSSYLYRIFRRYNKLTVYGPDTLNQLYCKYDTCFKIKLGRQR